MSLLFIPKWIKAHQYNNKDFFELSIEELELLKGKIGKFSSDTPEVSIVIPAWNEEKDLFRTLSSIASNITAKKVEIIVVNNNSTDRTQEILDILKVKTFFQTEQGISYTRQMGLDNAMGKYHLCADSDSFYPPKWIDAMIQPMIKDPEVVCVYGRYSFIPPEGSNRTGLYFYEKLSGLLIRFRKKREYINVLGFNMGFLTAAAKETTGFRLEKSRKFNNEKDSPDYTLASEDGQMALNLQAKGKLKLVTNINARVFTSARRLIYDGGILRAFIYRIKLHSGKILRSVIRK